MGPRFAKLVMLMALTAGAPIGAVAPPPPRRPEDEPPLPPGAKPQPRRYYDGEITIDGKRMERVRVEADLELDVREPPPLQAPTTVDPFLRSRAIYSYPPPYLPPPPPPPRCATCKGDLKDPAELDGLPVHVRADGKRECSRCNHMREVRNRKKARGR